MDRSENLAITDHKFIESASRPVDQNGTPHTTMSGSIKSIDTNDCAPWRLHNRDRSWFKGKSAESLQRSIGKFGQQQPGLVRKSQEQETLYEIVAGARRWAACQELGIRFEARVLEGDVPDAICAGLMEDENQQSENITEVERGLSYRKMIDAKVFPDMKTLGDELGVSKQYVSRIIKAASVFDVSWMAPMLEPCKTFLSTANCMALLRASETHGAEGRMKRAYDAMASSDQADGAVVAKQLLASVARKQKKKRSVLLRTGKKKAAESTLDEKGKLVVSIDTNVLKAEQIDELVQLLQSRLVDLNAERGVSSEKVETRNTAFTTLTQ